VTDRARDPRSARTQAALQAALRDLVSAGPLDAITVTDICRAAAVRRTSYYTHFDGVADQLAQLLIAPLEQALTIEPLPGDVAGTARTFQLSVVEALRRIAGDRTLYASAFSSSTSAAFRRALAAMLERRVLVALEIWSDLGEAADVDRRVAVPFAAGGLTLAFEAWSLTDADDDIAWGVAMRDQMAPWWPRVPLTPS
jgi:AcrR family transcriptional regulator